MDTEAITRRTYDRIANAYSRRTYQSQVRRGLRPSLLKFASLTRPGGKVLIAGAGDGRDGFFFGNRRFHPFYLDYSHIMNTITRRRDPSALAVTADLRTLPFESESFDGIWASMCLYHLRINSLQTCLNEIRRVARPGGIIYFNLRPGRGQRTVAAPWSFPHGGPRLYTRYLPGQILSMAKGFEPIRIQTTDRRLGRHLIQVWLRRPPLRGTIAVPAAARCNLELPD